MAKTIEIVERINSHANSWERDDALDAREPTEEARFWRETALTIVALAKALEPFAKISGEYEDTPDEIDGDVIFGHVPMADLRLARSELQKLYSPSTGGD
jgi:hypothetical protein